MSLNPKHWLAEIIVAITAAACLLLFFYPKPPDELVSIEGHENHNTHYETKGIFPASEIVFGMGYRCIHLYGRTTTTFLVDFALPASYRCGDNIRFWIRAKDLERLQANPDIEVRVYATDILDPDTQYWTHYVPQHPHGEGCFLAVGSLLTVLFLVMVVKKVCFNPSTKKFP